MPTQPNAPRELTLLAVAAASAALTAALAARVHADHDTFVDREIRHPLSSRGPSVRYAKSPALRAAALAGEKQVYGPAVALAMLAVAARRGVLQTLPLGAATFGGMAAHRLARRAVARPRPPLAVLVGKRSPSFPSGHTVRATAVALTIGYALARERLGPPAVVLPLAIGVPTLVGASRVYADVHWATDAVGGWTLGLTVAALSALAYERLRPIERPRILTRPLRRQGA